METVDPHSAEMRVIHSQNCPILVDRDVCFDSLARREVDLPATPQRVDLYRVCLQPPVRRRMTSVFRLRSIPWSDTVI